MSRRAAVLSAVITATLCLCTESWCVQGQLDTAQIPDQISGESTLSLTKFQAPSLQVLHVLECEGPQEWQQIDADEAVVAWMGNSTDRLTISQARPLGEDLTVHHRHTQSPVLAKHAWHAAHLLSHELLQADMLL